ncbi:MAG TPA: hypothetical protein VFI70_13090 [Nitrososphaeraceae archaeon]|nr:hypothetical protein [Nitrososphaeraceae archaeon]
MLTLTKQKKIRIELEDVEGDKYNLSLEGSMSRDKIVKACELMELLELRRQTTNNNDAAPSSENEVQVQQNKNLAAVGSKMWGLIEDKFLYASLGSTAIREMCEDGYDEPVQLSIILPACRAIVKEVILSGSKEEDWVYETTRQHSVIAILKDISTNMIQQPSEDRYDLSADGHSALYGLHQ